MEVPNAESTAEPDFALLEALSKLDGFVMAEGRYATPELAARALRSGADCVTVGSALTRLELMTQAFADAVGPSGPRNGDATHADMERNAWRT